MAKHRQRWVTLAIESLLGWVFACFCLVAQAHAQTIPIESLRIHKADEGLQLSADVNLELPPLIQEALLKGIAVVFVSHAKVLQDRWYWTDKVVADQVRQARLSYQPLTRRWRVQITESATSNDQGLSQNYENLTIALSAIRHTNRWKIADWSDLDRDAKYTVEFRFQLDTTQLPRPFQIGVSTSGVWNLVATHHIRFVHDGKTEATK
jgi:Domain of unknown function (DUF4390)